MLQEIFVSFAVVGLLRCGKLICVLQYRDPIGSSADLQEECFDE